VLPMAAESWNGSSMQPLVRSLVVKEI
jgi:hypothetical protein